MEEIKMIKGKGTGTFDRLLITATKKGKEMVSAVVKFIDGKYDQVVPLRVFGQTESIARGLNQGDVIEFDVRIGGREWQDKVFCDVTALSIVVTSAAAPPAKGGGTHHEVNGGDGAGKGDDDVPF
jgi:hypothetical protein